MPGTGTTTAPLDALRGVCAAREPDDGDAVDGVRPAAVASPSSVEEASALLHTCAEHDLAVVARGLGTKQDWGMPPARLDVVVDTTRIAGVVEHASGDLVAVVRAGTPVTDLQDVLSTAGQQLALDTPTADDATGGTVGGVVAASVSGPRRLLYGTTRDLLIGATVVRADGVVARSGGKVVKNVAGYDLGKLVGGSYGTLALLVDAAFRLHPLPTASRVVRVTVDDPHEASRLAAAARSSQLVPAAVEVDAPGAVGGGVEVAVLVEGTETGVGARARAARRLLGGDPSDGVTEADERPPWWGRLPFGRGDVGLKVGVALSGVGAVLAAARAAGQAHGIPVAVRGSAGSGVLHAGLPVGADPAAAAAAGAVLGALRDAVDRHDGHVVVLSAPAAVRDAVDVWGPVGGLELMRRVKAQLDPGRRLAPGRFVGGI